MVVSTVLNGEQVIVFSVTVITEGVIGSITISAGAGTTLTVSIHGTEVSSNVVDSNAKRTGKNF